MRLCTRGGDINYNSAMTTSSVPFRGCLSLFRRSFALHSMALAQVIGNASAGETCVVPASGKNSTGRTFVCPEPLDSEKDTYCCGFSPNYFCCSKPFDTFAVVMGGILTSILFLAVSYAIIAYIHNFVRRRRARRIQHGMAPCRPDSEIFQFAEGLSAEEREKAILARATGDDGTSRRASPPSPQHRLILPAPDCRKNSSSTFNEEEEAGCHYREDLDDRVELDEDMFMTDVRTRRSNEKRLTGATSGLEDHAAVVIVPSDRQPPQGRTTIA